MIFILYMIDGFLLHLRSRVNVFILPLHSLFFLSYELFFNDKWNEFNGTAMLIKSNSLPCITIKVEYSKMVNWWNNFLLLNDSIKLFYTVYIYRSTHLKLYNLTIVNLYHDRSDYSTEVDRMMATPVMPPEQNGTSSRELKENTNFVDRPFPSKNQIFGLNFIFLMMNFIFWQMLNFLLVFFFW
jgi:hypothetical protein